MSGGDVVQAVIDSGLRGRGGAKASRRVNGPRWPINRRLPMRANPANAPTHKYICVNADEGDSGTFADRMLMRATPSACSRA